MTLKKFTGCVISAGDHTPHPGQAPIRMAQALPRLQRIRYDLVPTHSIGNPAENMRALPTLRHQPVLS